MPATARGRSAKAAKAFVRYYIATINYAAATGDISRVESVSAAHCSSCVSVIDRIKEVYRAGGQIRGRGWQIVTERVVPGQSMSRPLVDVGLKLAPQVVTKHAGAPPTRFHGGRVPLTFHLGYRQHGWVVKQWERAA